MQYWTGIHAQLNSMGQALCPWVELKSDILSLPWCSKIMHCGILFQQVRLLSEYESLADLQNEMIG